MPFFWLAGAGLLSSGIGALGASSAANTEANAANSATAEQLAMFTTTKGLEQPFVGAGVNALQNLQNLTGNYPGGVGPDGTPYAAGTGSGPLNTPFSPAQYQASPGYAFQMGQGEQAIDDTASARGGVAGGNTLKALTTFGQGLANSDYQQALINYMAQQNQQFGQLDTLATGGQNAAANLGSTATTVGSNVANNITGAGNASAAGTVSATNALTGGIQGLGSNYLLAQLLGQGGGGAGGLDFNPFASAFGPGAAGTVA